MRCGMADRIGRMSKGEDTLIARIAARVRGGGADLALGIGDDMAVLRVGGEDVLVACDMLVDGVHFDASAHTPEQIGRKALAVNLSDCAAMAVRPWAAVVSVALPEGWSMEEAERLFAGMEALAGAYGCRIVGGDTNSWERPLVVDVTVLGRPWEGVAPVRRSGARAGDAVWVTGELGGSLYAGGGAVAHHLGFEPRVGEARWLAEALGDDLHAMMDLSDGLSTDGGRLGRASGVGIELDGAAVESVASEAARAASASDGRPLLSHVLDDGEDFELLFVTAADWAPAEDDAGVCVDGGVFKNPPRSPLSTGGKKEPARMTRIGRVVEEAGVWLVETLGGRRVVRSGGWLHFGDV